MGSKPLPEFIFDCCKKSKAMFFAIAKKTGKAGMVCFCMVLFLNGAAQTGIIVAYPGQANKFIAFMIAQNGSDGHRKNAVQFISNEGETGEIVGGKIEN